MTGIIKNVLIYLLTHSYCCSSYNYYYNCIVLYLYNYLALLAVHTNQKRFQLYDSAALVQCYCRAIVCEELAQGPYTVGLIVWDEARTRRSTLHALYKPNALTDRPSCYPYYNYTVHTI